MNMVLETTNFWSRQQSDMESSVYDMEAGWTIYCEPYIDFPKVKEKLKVER